LSRYVALVALLLLAACSKPVTFQAKVEGHSFHPAWSEVVQRPVYGTRLGFDGKLHTEVVAWRPETVNHPDRWELQVRQDDESKAIVVSRSLFDGVKDGQVVLLRCRRVPLVGLVDCRKAAQWGAL
jgi:hypothetical protein